MDDEDEENVAPGDRKYPEKQHPPTICPPEMKRAQMFKSPVEFKPVDDQVFNVRTIR